MWESEKESLNWSGLTWDYTVWKESRTQSAALDEEAPVWALTLPLSSPWLYSGHLTSGSLGYPIHRMRLIRTFSQSVMSSKWKQASRLFTGVSASWWETMTHQPLSYLRTGPCLPWALVYPQFWVPGNAPSLVFALLSVNKHDINAWMTVILFPPNTLYRVTLGITGANM